jgi:amino acid transporter
MSRVSLVSTPLPTTSRAPVPQAALGFFAGWSVIIGSILFMVSGTLPAATATLKLFVPSLVDNQNAVTLVASGWLVVIGGVVAKGIKLASYTQIVFTVVEVGVVALVIALVAMCYSSAPAHAFSFAWFCDGPGCLDSFRGGIS